MTDTETEIAEAEAAERAAQDALHKARQRLEGLYIRRSTERFGIEVGMIVRGGRRKMTGRVCGIRPDSWANSKPWVYVRMFKKDGTEGERETCFYGDWEIVSS